MPNSESRYITNAKGKRVGVILDIEEYERIMTDLEDLADIRAYDSAKAEPDEAIPFEQAIEEIERLTPP